MSYHSRLDLQRRWERRQRLYNAVLAVGLFALWAAIWWVILVR